MKWIINNIEGKNISDFNFSLFESRIIIADNEKNIKKIEFKFRNNELYLYANSEVKIIWGFINSVNLPNGSIFREIKKINGIKNIIFKNITKNLFFNEVPPFLKISLK